jgi:hypothetical protein
VTAAGRRQLRGAATGARRGAPPFGRPASDLLRLTHAAATPATPIWPPSALQDVSNVLWGVAKLTKERSCGITSPQPSASVGVTSSLPSLASASSAGAAARAVAPPAADAGAAGDARAATPSGAPGQLPAPEGNVAAVAEPLPDGSKAEADAAGVPPAAPAAETGGGSKDASGEVQLQPAATDADAAPLLTLAQVSELLEHLCNHLPQTMVQTISNSLWAVVVLQQEHGWCMCGCLVQVQLLLHTFCQQPREALPGHIQPVIRCMVQLATACAVHNGDAWLSWQPPVLQRLLGHLFAHRAHLEQHHISSVLRDIAQLACILMLLQRRRAEGAGGAPTGGAQGMGAGEMLQALARSTGPPDTTSTMLALGMLRPQLAEMGLLPSVQHLCGMLACVANYTQVCRGEGVGGARWGATRAARAPCGRMARACLRRRPMRATACHAASLKRAPGPMPTPAGRPRRTPDRRGGRDRRAAAGQHRQPRARARRRRRRPDCVWAADNDKLGGGRVPQRARVGPGGAGRGRGRRRCRGDGCCRRRLR